jgi:hypothetical protein
VGMADALENACIDGHPQIVEYLLSKNAADCFDDDIYVCFHEFVMRTWAADYDSVSESNKTAILMIFFFFFDDECGVYSKRKQCKNRS